MFLYRKQRRIQVKHNTAKPKLYNRDHICTHVSPTPRLHRNVHVRVRAHPRRSYQSSDCSIRETRELTERRGSRVWPLGKRCVEGDEELGGVSVDGEAGRAPSERRGRRVWLSVLRWEGENGDGTLSQEDSSDSDVARGKRRGIGEAGAGPLVDVDADVDGDGAVLLLEAEERRGVLFAGVGRREDRAGRAGEVVGEDALAEGTEPGDGDPLHDDTPSAENESSLAMLLPPLLRRRPPTLLPRRRTGKPQDW